MRLSVPRACPSLLLVLLGCLLAGSLAADTLTPEGGDSEANNVFSGRQFLPDLAARGDGTFIVGWEGDLFGDFGVRVRRITPKGVAVSNAHSVATCEGCAPELAGLSDDRVVLVWRDGGQVFARWIVDPFTQGPDITLAESPTDPQDPTVAADGTGTFLALWHDCCDLGEPFLRARRFDVDGTPLGSSFEVARSALLAPIGGHLALASNGVFLAAWEEAGALAGRLGQADDTFGAPSFPLDSQPGGGPTGLRVAAAPDGTFLAVWESSLSAGDDNDGLSIQARVVDAAGVPVGPQFQVNSFTVGDQHRPDIAFGPASKPSAFRFLIVWESSESDVDPSGSSIRMTRVSAPATVGGAWTVEPDIPVNFIHGGNQVAPRVTASTRLALVAWETPSVLLSNSPPDIVYRTFLPCPRGVFSDGFNSGNTSAWSQTVP